MSPLAALLLDWVLTACWPLIGALGMRHYSGILFANGGLLLGGVLLCPFILKGGRWRALFDRRTAPVMAAMGFLSGGVTIIFISALNFTSPANAAIMAQVEVLYSALLCGDFLRERISAKQALASSLIVAGTALIMLNDLSSPRWKGDLMILASPWMFQLSHLLAKRLPVDIDGLTLAAGRIFYGLVTLAPFSFWSLWHGGRWSWEPQALTILAVQGVLMSCVNFVLWYKAIRGMDLSKATAIMLSYPALTVLFSWTLGREEITLVQIAGLWVTLAGASWISMLVRRDLVPLARGAAKDPLP